MTQIQRGNAVVSRYAEQRGSSSSTASSRYVALGSHTEGEFGLFDYRIAAGAPGAVPHYHEHFTESFYVLEGRLSLFDGNDWMTAAPGDLVYVPKKSVHAFRNDTDAEARFVIVFTPGAPREEYFDELASLRATGRELTTEEIDELAARHGQINVR
ncbi:MAG: cupin domain-containing protein [Mycobacteriales bacterium]